MSDKNTLIFNNIYIESRESDNFINATQLCQVGNKRFSDWYLLDSTKKIIKELENEYNMINLIKTEENTFYKGCIWIDPDLAIQLVSWIDPSPISMIKVCRWINSLLTYRQTSLMNIELKQKLEEKMQVLLMQSKEIKRQNMQLDKIIETQKFRSSKLSKYIYEFENRY